MTNVTDISNNVSKVFDNESYDVSMESIVDHELMSIIVPIVFVWLMLIGVTGNASLVYIILREKSLRTVPNALIVNMSIGDLLLLIFSAPFFAIVFGRNEYPFDEFVCKLNAYLQTLSLGVSIFTLTALSWDRYVAIVHPMSRHKGRPRLKIAITIAAIWISSALIAISDGVNFTLVNSHGSSFCIEFPHTIYRKYLRYRSLLRFLVMFIIPLFIIGGLYAVMARILVKSSHHMPCEETLESCMNRQQRRQMKDRIKVAKFVLSLVVLFVFCWLPRHIYVLWYAWDEESFTDFWLIFKIISICLMYAYSCVNPYALFCLSRQFRKFYLLYLFRCCTRSRYQTHDDSTFRRGSSSLTMVNSDL